MFKKPSLIQLLRLFDFSQSENRKTIEKPLKERLWNQQKWPVKFGNPRGPI